MKPQTVALYTAGVALAAGLGYAVYFDYKRRNDPLFRKQLKRERKRLAKEEQEKQKDQKANKIKVIEEAIIAVARETFPVTPQDREQYFLAQITEGETLAGKGEAFYDAAVLPFYKALKVYPQPQELLGIYQKTVPLPVFEMIITILNIEQQSLQSASQAEPEEQEIAIDA